MNITFWELVLTKHLPFIGLLIPYFMLRSTLGVVYVVKFNSSCSQQAELPSVSR